MVEETGSAVIYHLPSLHCYVLRLLCFSETSSCSVSVATLAEISSSETPAANSRPGGSKVQKVIHTIKKLVALPMEELH